MAQVQAFTQALIRCGFNNDTAGVIIQEGMETIDSLLVVDDDDIDAMVKNIRETRRVLGAVAVGDVTFPFVAVKRFKAMRNWTVERARTGQVMQAGAFFGAEIPSAVSRYALEKLRKSVEDDDIDKPSELSDLTKWDIFWERFKSYIGQKRGAAKCPLTYVFRDEAEVLPAAHAEVYDDHDARLVATTLLQNDWFDLDNHRVYDEFKALVVKGPGWSFIKTFDRRKDGRGAVLALKQQCEGVSAIQTRKASAYARITVARYTGQKRNFTFDQYVEMHQNAYNTLAELDETVPETKKVTDFLAGISDPKLSNAKDMILGDIAKLTNFEACQQYLKTLVYNKATQDKHERNVSGLSGKDLGNNNKRKGGRGGKGGGTPRGDVTRSYTREEWLKLSDEQRQKIRNLRNAKKARQEGDRNSQVSSLTQDGGANSSIVSGSTNGGTGGTDPVNSPTGSAKRG